MDDVQKFSVVFSMKKDVEALLEALELCKVSMQCLYVVVSFPLSSGQISGEINDT